ncbi:hypothetical protein [Streptococcus ovuberis]|nr:hypothetical protein [Streptococcus ovuberis]
MGKRVPRTSKLTRLIQIVTIVLPAIQVVRGMIQDYKADKRERK